MIRFFNKGDEMLRGFGNDKEIMPNHITFRQWLFDPYHMTMDDIKQAKLNAKVKYNNI